MRMRMAICILHPGQAATHLAIAYLHQPLVALLMPELVLRMPSDAQFRNPFRAEVDLTGSAHVRLQSR